jgi:hypothetical protein
MSEYDDLLRSLLVERYRPVVPRQPDERDHLQELAQALSREKRRRDISSSESRSATRGGASLRRESRTLGQSSLPTLRQFRAGDLSDASGSSTWPFHIRTAPQR